VTCSNLKSIGGVKDFYLTASGVSGEAIVRNIVFASSSGEIVCNQEPCGDPISSSSGAEITSSSSGTDAIIPRAVRHDMQVPVRKAYRDLKGRSFDKQIPYRVMF
jgi:arabinan endo-1,5-alpha-L-arabinosidase